MRLAFDARMATWGGVGTYTRELLTALLRGRDSLGIEHVVAFRSPDDAFLEESVGRAGITWEVAPGSPWSPIANTRMGLAARGRADVFHAPHFPVPLGFNGPLVTTIHDLIPLLVPESMPGAARRLVYKAMVRWAVARSDVIVCGTRVAAETLTARLRPIGHLVVVHHGLGSASIAMTAVEARHETRHRQDKGPFFESPGYVLWVGAMKPHKDVHTLLEAHRMLPDEVRRRHPLVLAGDDTTEEGRVIHAAVASGAATDRECVRILGRVPAERLADLYANAAVFAFPSRIEGFGLPPLEAMAHNVPIISSDAQPMREVLGDAAAYFPTGDPSRLATRLLEVLTSESRQAELRIRGQARIRRFSWQRAAAETASAYRLALSGAAPGLAARGTQPESSHPRKES